MAEGKSVISTKEEANMQQNVGEWKIRKALTREIEGTGNLVFILRVFKSIVLNTFYILLMYFVEKNC